MVAVRNYTAEYVRWGRKITNISKPVGKGAGRLVNALFQAGFDGVAREDLVRVAGYLDEHSLHGAVHWLRTAHGIAIVTRGHLPGSAHRPARMYLAPFHLPPGDVKCAV
jgi:hypothetical protein